VTVKVDVSYTDHSHIIGKGGFTIKKVMDETGCHIHFPDSNRNNQTEKSNLVSIAGDVRGVERARAKVRVSQHFIWYPVINILYYSQRLA
jgi:protein bicaudal C